MTTSVRARSGARGTQRSLPTMIPAFGDGMRSTLCALLVLAAGMPALVFLGDARADTATAPVVVLADPGSTLTGSVTLTASATPSTGRTISSVAFERSPTGTGSWTSIDMGATAPYTVVLDTTALADGSFDLRAIAVDSSGESGTSPVLTRPVSNQAAAKPTVSLVDPGVRISGTVAVTADAAAAAGRTVASVEFQVAEAGTSAWVTYFLDSTDPYVAPFDTTLLADGVYDLRAVVTDDSGAVAASPLLLDRIVNNNSGGTTVALVDPGLTLRDTVSLSARLNSFDPSVQAPITEVDFQVSPADSRAWTTVGVALNEPYTTELDTTTLADGRYSLRVVVVDDAGGRLYSPTVADRFIDNTAPTVAIANPGSPLIGRVQVSATASDQDGSGIASLRFERSVAGRGTWILIGTDFSTPFSAGFDTQRVPNGSYDFRAVARDKAGNVTVSDPVTGVTVDNPVVPPIPTPKMQVMMTPAHGMVMLGAVSGSAEHEAWAYGFTSAAPAEAAGSRLPYTAFGEQLVLLRHTDTAGWQIVDVLRNADGSAFELLPPDEVGGSGPLIRGAMAGSGEAWLWLAETSKSGSKPPVVGLFHRSPGGRFLLDEASTVALGRSLLSPIGVSAVDGGGGLASLRLRSGPSGKLSGVLVAPGQRPRSQTISAAGGTPIPVLTGLDYGVLIDGVWTKRRALLPTNYLPRAGDFVVLRSADIEGDATGWAALSVTRGGPSTARTPLYLARFVGDQWNYVTIGFDALELSGEFAGPGIAVRPTGLRANGDTVWLSAGVDAGSSGKVVVRYDDRSGTVTDSWCQGMPRVSASCAATLDSEHPAAVPDAIFETPGGEVAYSSQSNSIGILASGEWTRFPAPGFSAGSATFASATEGWFAGNSGVGHWIVDPPDSPLVRWSQPNRSPLVAVALPPGDAADLALSGPLAVGFDGTALHYDAVSGWLLDPLPPRASHLNLLGLAFDGPASAVAVGQFGAILHWDGTAWREDPQSLSVTQSQLNAVAFGPGGEGWAVGVFGTILHYDGTKWTREEPPSVDVGVNITSVAVAGSRVVAVAGGNLISRETDGSWSRLDPSLLPTDPAPGTGVMRLVSALPDGALVAAGKSVILVSNGPGEPFTYGPQPIEGIPVALAATRSGSGEVRAIVSVAPPAIDPNTGLLGDDIAGFPAGDGELLRQADDGGWQDISQAQYPGTVGQLPGDGAVKVDPVLAVAASSDGRHLWAVGGYAGTITSAGLGTATILPARPLGWRTSSIWRFDEGLRVPPAALEVEKQTIPARAGTVSFAFFSSPTCRDQCSATVDAQPDVNLRSAASQIATFAKEPGGPAFAVLGGNARGPLISQSYRAGNGAADFVRLPQLLAPLGEVPLFAAFGTLDSVPGVDDPTQPWADAFAASPAPFGSGPSAPNLAPAGSGPAKGGVRRYYAFDAAQNGGTIRVIVIDNAAGPLSQGAPDQLDWLRGTLADARSRSLPTVVVAANSRRGDPPTATLLADSGVVAIFSGNVNQLNEKYLVPERSAGSGDRQVPEYEGASLGYQQAGNNGVVWYFVSVDTRTSSVKVDAIPVIDSLALKPLQGLDTARSFTLEFQAIARRPVSSLATIPTDATFPGYDSYVSIPAASCGDRPCVQPTYTFSSSDPTIGDFVEPSSAGSRFPQLDGKGRTRKSSTSGLFCGFNTGTTTVKVSTGLLAYSLPVTVGPGGFGPPCGTVFRAGVNPIVVVQRDVNTQGQSPAGSGVPPPPPSPAPAVEPALPVVVPPPAPAPLLPPAPTPPPPAPIPPAPQPAPVPSPAPAPAPEPIAVVQIVPPPVPPVQPIPPGGAVAQAPSAAPRKEKAHKHASQSAFTIRPAGSRGDEWFYASVGFGAVAAMLLLGFATSRRVPQAAPAEARRFRRP